MEVLWSWTLQKDRLLYNIVPAVPAYGCMTSCGGFACGAVLGPRGADVTARDDVGEMCVGDGNHYVNGWITQAPPKAGLVCPRLPGWLAACLSTDVQDYVHAEYHPCTACVEPICIAWLLPPCSWQQIVPPTNLG